MRNQSTNPPKSSLGNFWVYTVWLTLEQPHGQKVSLNMDSNFPIVAQVEFPLLPTLHTLYGLAPPENIPCTPSSESYSTSQEVTLFSPSLYEGVSKINKFNWCLKQVSPPCSDKDDDCDG